MRNIKNTLYKIKVPDAVSAEDSDKNVNLYKLAIQPRIKMLL
jgi:hypothetical protein